MRPGHLAPVVLSMEALQEVVAAIRKEGAFCFDVETRGVIDHHPDVRQLIDDEWVLKRAELKSTNANVIATSKRAIEDRWTKELALDPLRNEVTWIGIAVSGMSWAIPISHRNGEVLVPEERGDGTTVPPPGYRAILGSGKESTAKAKYRIPAVFTAPPVQLPSYDIWQALEPVFMDAGIAKVGHNIKFDARSISKYIGGLPQGDLIDTQQLMHIVNENLMKYSLQAVVAKVFEGWDPYWRHGKQGADMEWIAFSKAALYVHLDARSTWLAYRKLLRTISKVNTLVDVMYKDMAVTRPLAQMESNGILVNTREMGKLGRDLEIQKNQLLLDMSQYAPIGFSPDSNVHKAQLLFSKKTDGGLGFKPVKMTAGGKASVDESVMEKLQGKHPMIDLLLEWAEVGKMKSTYVDGLTYQLHHGRLHPQFHLHRTATGRLSSSGPNLQNIPRDGRVRSLFTCEPENSLLVADYDQIELRLLAVFSQDPALIKIFLDGIDVHTGTAAVILGKAPEDVTSEERQIYGKTPNFLMGYGGGAQRLVDATKGAISLQRAKEVVDAYNKGYAGMTAWKQEVAERGRRMGYVETAAGRRRRLPDLNSNDRSTRLRAERQAVNAVIQGTAAEICKDAVVAVDKAFEFPKCKLLVQVHDEIVASVPTAELNIWQPIMTQAMGDGDIMEGGIPLKVSCGYAGSWADAK